MSSLCLAEEGINFSKGYTPKIKSAPGPCSFLGQKMSQYKSQKYASRAFILLFFSSHFMLSACYKKHLLLLNFSYSFHIIIRQSSLLLIEDSQSP